MWRSGGSRQPDRHRVEASTAAVTEAFLAAASCKDFTIPVKWWLFGLLSSLSAWQSSVHCILFKFAKQRFTLPEGQSSMLPSAAASSRSSRSGALDRSPTSQYVRVFTYRRWPTTFPSILMAPKWENAPENPIGRPELGDSVPHSGVPPQKWVEYEKSNYLRRRNDSERIFIEKPSFESAMNAKRFN